MASSANKDTYEITLQDAADILAGTLELLRDKGFSIGLRNAEANAKRAVGLMVFIEGLRLNDDGAIFAVREPAPQNDVANGVPA
jgi:hypothetical protein